MEREPAQAAFLNEVQDWASGKLTGSFSIADELQSLAIRAIHDWEVRDMRGARSAPEELFSRATEVAGEPARRPELVVAMAFGPLAMVMPAREFESPATEERVYDEAIATGLFRKMTRIETARDGGVLQLADGRTKIRLAQDGALAISVDPTIERSDRTMLSAIVDEDLTAKLAAVLGFARILVEEFDPTERSSDIAGFVVLRDVDWLPWRTAAEYASIGGSGTMNSRGESGIQLNLPETPNKRTRFFYRAQQIAEETAVLLRREATRQ